MENVTTRRKQENSVKYYSTRSFFVMKYIINKRGDSFANFYSYQLILPTFRLMELIAQ